MAKLVNRGIELLRQPGGLLLQCQDGAQVLLQKGYRSPQGVRHRLLGLDIGELILKGAHRPNQSFIGRVAMLPQHGISQLFATGTQLLHQFAKAIENGVALQIVL